MFKPVLSNAVKVMKSEPIKNASKQILNTGIDLATNVIADSLEGSNIKQSGKQRLDEAKKEIATVIRETRTKNNKPKNNKRKKKNISVKIKTKKLKKDLDIFDDDDNAT